MHEKAIYCRAQAALARHHAAGLAASDTLRGALERNARAFDRLAGHFEEAGTQIEDAAIAMAGAEFVHLAIEASTQAMARRTLDAGPDEILTLQHSAPRPFSRPNPAGICVD